MNRMECTGFFILTLCLVHVAYSQQPPSDSTRGRNTATTTTVPPPANICSCYYSSDCKGRTATCQRGSYCLPSGKNDGVCNIGTAPTPLPNLDALSEENREVLLSDRRAISAAVDAYFRSFVKAIENGGGFPDPNLLQDALNARLSQTAHDRVEQAVWVSLDAVMGWDFESPNLIQKAQGFAGNVREVGGVQDAAGIVDATRRGFLKALETNDAGNVVPPLLDFWSKNPRYMPHHLGRCYPHGHAEIRDMKAAIACQTDVLQRAAGMLIDTANAVAAQGGHEDTTLQK